MVQTETTGVDDFSRVLKTRKHKSQLQEHLKHVCPTCHNIDNINNSTTRTTNELYTFQEFFEQITFSGAILANQKILVFKKNIAGIIFIADIASVWTFRL